MRDQAHLGTHWVGSRWSPLSLAPAPLVFERKREVSNLLKTKNLGAIQRHTPAVSLEAVVSDKEGGETVLVAD